MTIDLPRPEGFVHKQSAAVQDRDRAPRKPLPVRPGMSFSALDDYEFFTTALLHLYGQIGEPPWIDLAHANPGLVYYWRKFDLPIFTGLGSPSGDQSWNYTLFAVHRKFFPPLLRTMAQWGILDPPTGHVFRYFPQELFILDPFVLHDTRIVTNRVPIVSITGFGVAGVENRYGFMNANDPRTGQPQAIRAASDGESLRFARALAAGENPLAGTVKDSWKSVLARTKGKLKSGQTIEEVPW